MLPGLLGAVGSQALAKGDGGWGDALAHFTKGYLGSKQEGAMKKRERKIGQEDYLIKEAYKAVDDLNGADLAGLKDIPDFVKSQVADLHRKAQEALMNDGVISGKEASELLALSGPVRQAIAEAKGKQATPEAQAIGKERGLLAGFTEQARNAHEMPLNQAEEGDVLPGRSEEQIQNMGKDLYGEAKEAESPMYVEGVGMVPKKTGTAILGKREGLASIEKRTKDALNEKVQARLATDSRFQQALGTKDARIAGETAKAMVSKAVGEVMANMRTSGESWDEETIKAKASEQLQLMMTMMGGKVPGSRGPLDIPVHAPAPTPGPAQPKPGDVKTFPNGRKGRWDGKGWLPI